jgi:hypothetical protein
MLHDNFLFEKNGRLVKGFIRRSAFSVDGKILRFLLHNG